MRTLKLMLPIPNLVVTFWDSGTLDFGARSCFALNNPVCGRSLVVRSG